jgi:hypothetical protein
MGFRLVLLLLALPYPWLKAPAKDDIARRIAPPAGATRVGLAEGSFGDWLRHLPLLPAGTQVHLFDGSLKSRQDVHAAVVDLDVGTRDLQQCADAVMRLRAEYLWAAGRERDIKFHVDLTEGGSPPPRRAKPAGAASPTGPGKPTEIAWSGGRDRRAFAKFMVHVFAEAGTASLAAEMAPLRVQLEPGDVLIQGGYPGHAVLVLDAADSADGHHYVLLGQSYMPAQQFHVLRNFGDAKLSPWFDASGLDGRGIQTPEWRPFVRRDARRF